MVYMERVEISDRKLYIALRIQGYSKIHCHPQRRALAAAPTHTFIWRMATFKESYYFSEQSCVTAE